jgi:hypothetical protein
MFEPSIYRPPADLSTAAPVNLNTVSDSAEVAASAEPTAADWAATLKRVLAGVVVVAGAGAAIFPPHTIVHQVCVAILGLGGLGITSTGNGKK